MVHQFKRINNGIDRDEQCGWHQQGKGDPPEVVPSSGTLHNTCFLEFRGKLLQCGQIEYHEKSGLLPDHHDNKAEQGRVRVAQPIMAVPAKEGKHLIKQPVFRGVKKKPDIGNGYHG